jgi:hypothetical protein
MAEDDPTKSPGILGRLNNSLTAIGAVVGTIGGIASALAAMLASSAKDEAAGAKKEAGEAKEAVVQAVKKANEESTQKFAANFLETLQQIDKDLSQEQRSKLVISVMNIVTLANANELGKTPPELRRALACKLNLYTGNWAQLAEVDPDLSLYELWSPRVAELVDQGETAEYTKTNQTAFLAICNIAKDLREPAKLLQAMERLRQLWAALKKDPGIAKLGLDAGEAIATGDDEDTGREGKEVQKARLDSATRLLTLVTALRPLRDRILGKGWSKADDESFLTESELYRTKLIAFLDSTLDAQRGAKSGSDLKAGSLLAAQVVKERAVEPPPPAAPLAAQGDDNLAKLIEGLKQGDPGGAAQSGLAALGPAAVPPLVEALEQSGVTGKPKDNLTLGVARILVGIKKPPLKLEVSQADTVIAQLLASSDDRTRSLLVTTLLNLDDAQTARNCIPALLRVVEEDKRKTGDAPAGVSAVTVLTGWLKALHPSFRSPTVVFQSTASFLNPIGLYGDPNVSIQDYLSKTLKEQLATDFNNAAMKEKLNSILQRFNLKL